MLQKIAKSFPLAIGIVLLLSIIGYASYRMLGSLDLVSSAFPLNSQLH
ncbi:MAG: hypothetical protein R3C53_17550 [Pirellulaceae bacterium]